MPYLKATSQTKITNSNQSGLIFFAARFDFFCFAFFEVGGGGVAIIRFMAASKLSPFVVTSFAFGILGINHKPAISATWN